MSHNPLHDVASFQVRHLARKLIIEFGERAHVIARSEADRCFKADASVEARKWLELADAVARITPGTFTKIDGSD